MSNASRHSATSCCLIAIGSLMMFAFFGFIESPASASASEGPVAAYSFDEGEGTTAEDVTGDGHTATIHGAKWTTHGRYGGALEFDAAEEDYVSIPASEELDQTEEFTIEAWVRPVESPLWANILMKERGGGGPRYSYALYQHHEQAQGYFMETNEGRLDGEEASLPLGTWTHLAITDDGAHTRLYVNGELEDMSPALSVEGHGEIRIGGDGIWGEYFDGRIDEVRIYNRALNEGEVQGDMEAPIQTPQAGPVAAYSFDEGEGTTAEDVTGNGHTATIHGAKWTTHGRYGGALEFDAAEEDYVSIPASEELDQTEEFTIEAWVRPVESPLWANILMKEREGSGPRYSYALYQHEDEARGYFMETTEGILFGEEGSLPLGAWTHLTITDDGAHSRLYVDGELVDTSPAVPVEGHGEIRIGGDSIWGEYFDGRIDEVRIYDRALNGAEVAADKSAPIQTPQAGPVAAYSFDEGEGTSVEDVTGNGHTATIEGATWARGKYGDGLEFNGTSSCVTVPESSELQLTEEFTLEAWVRPIGSGEEANPFLTQVDESAGEEEEPWSYMFLAGEDEVPKAWVRKGGEAGFQGIYGTEPLPEKAWAHLAVTDDGAHLRLYVDGELVRTTAAPNLTAGHGPLKIGCAFGSYFEGRIDEVRIYNRALNEGEVQGDKEAPIQTPQAGPVAAYSFDEGEGTSAEDVTGNGHTATLEGATWARGKYGDGLEFNGTSSCVSIAASSDLQLTEEFTLEAWVRPTGSGEEANPFLAMEDTSAGEEEEPYAYEFLAGEKESPKAWVRKGGEAGFQGIYGTEPLPEHAWAHLALTDDGAKLRLYVNGELVRTTAAPDVTAASGPLKVGCGAFGAHFEGRIDELRIYNRVLDGPEVAADKEAPIQTPQAGPVAAYSFDEGEGTTAEDVTGNGHTATIEGAEWTDRGKYGSALKFNGTSSCVTVPESSELDFSEEFTLESWVKPEGELHHDPIVFKEGAGFPSYALGIGIPHSAKAEGVIGQEGEGHENVYSSESLEAKVWSHLALTYDGAKLRLYVNGELVATEAVENTDSGSPGPLTIGCDALYGNYFKGRIDELRIYNRALSEAELRQTMNAGFPMAITEAATEVEANDAILNGTADANGGETEYFFEYGPTESYGSVVMGEELGSDREAIEISEAAVDLVPETTYHYRLVAESPAGTTYGKDQTFTTSERTMTVGEEEELTEAEDKMELTASESKAGPGSFYGMMWTGNLKKMQKENIYEAVERSGAKTLRLLISPAEQTLDEEAFEEATSSHVNVLPYFGSGPFPKAGTPNRANWINFAETMVEKYGPGSSYSRPVTNWEVWNEPNMPFKGRSDEQEGKVNPQAFAGFLKEMSEALKSAAKEKGVVQILAPGLFGYRVPGCHPECHLTPRVFLKRMDQKLTELGTPGAYDAISLHPYVFKTGEGRQQHAPRDEGDVRRISSAIKRVITSVHALKPSKPIWVTEVGFPVENPGNKANVPPVTNSIQKLLVHASFSMMQNNRERLNIAHAFYYNIQDDALAGWEYHSGLLRLNGSARPAWTAYSNLAGGKSCPHAPC